MEDGLAHAGAFKLAPYFLYISRTSRTNSTVYAEGGMVRGLNVGREDSSVMRRPAGMVGAADGAMSLPTKYVLFVFGGEERLRFFFVVDFWAICVMAQ